MYKGSPVVGATVTFMAAGAPRAAAGVTNDKGEFQLSTFGANDGAVVGEHSITVVKVAGEAAPAATNPRDMMGRPGTMTDTYRERLGNQGQVAVAQSELPAKYAKVETSGLKETVTAEGPNKFVIQLTD